MNCSTTCPVSKASIALWQHLSEQAGDRYSHILDQLIEEIEKNDMTLDEFAAGYRSAWSVLELQTA